MRADTVSRFELIGPQGREVVLYDVHVEMLIQDDGRTMKVFISPRKVSGVPAVAPNGSGEVVPVERSPRSRD